MKITYFGYGSLVNRDTVSPHAIVTPGRLSGWRREWRVSGGKDGRQGRCALSVRRVPGEEILGVLLSEPAAGLGDLEIRERRYRKVEGIGGEFLCEADQNAGPSGMFVFEALPEHRRWGCDAHPILQSYLDCVLAGYFQIWGDAGVHHFFETTDGWHVPVLKDREAPIYPRAIALEPDLAEMIDLELRGRGVRFL